MQKNPQMPRLVNEACPDKDYYRTTEVRPFMDNGDLHVFNGRGAWRGNSTPNVTSTVCRLTAHAIHVNVVGWHRYTKSPEGGDYYFVYDEKKAEWVRKTAQAKAVKQAIEEKRIADRDAKIRAEIEAKEAADRAEAERERPFKDFPAIWSNS